MSFEVANENELPAILSSPAPSPPVTLPRPAPPPPPPTSSWAPGEREASLSRLPEASFAEVAGALGIPDDVTRFVIDGGDAPPAFPEPSGARVGVWRRRPWLDLVLGLGPEKVARLLRVHAKHWRATPEALAAFVARFELDAILAIACFSAEVLDEATPALLPLGDVRLAEIIARRSTQAGEDDRNDAARIAWLTKHAAHTAWALIAGAFDGEAGRSRAARTALRRLSARGLGPAIDRAARDFGIDPALLLTEPTERVRLPAFWQVGRATPPVLRSGKRLPDAAIERLVELLVTAPTPQTIDATRSACTEESLRKFALDVFAAFLRGAPRDGSGRAVTGLWPTVLSAFGGDDAVPALVKSLSDRKIERCEPIVDAICQTLAEIRTERAIDELVRLASRPRSQIAPATIQDGAERALETLGEVPGRSAQPSPEELAPFAPTPEEIATSAIVRFKGTKLSTSRALPAAWRLGPPGVNGIIDRFERRLPPGRIAALAHSGIDMGDAPPRSIVLGELTVRGAQGRPSSLHEVDATLVAELIRDVATLVAARR